MPRSHVAHSSRSSSRSVMPLRTAGRSVMPHSRGTARWMRRRSCRPTNCREPRAASSDLPRDTSFLPALPRVPASRAMRVSQSTPERGIARGRGGRRLPRAAAQRGAHACRMCSRDISARLHISRKLFFGSGGRSRWLSHARTGPTFGIGSAPRRCVPPSRKCAGAS